MVFTLLSFNNMLTISWRSVLFVEEGGVPWENELPIASHWQSLSHNDAVSSTPHHQRDSNCTNWIWHELYQLAMSSAYNINTYIHTLKTLTWPHHWDGGIKMP